MTQKERLVELLQKFDPVAFEEPNLPSEYWYGADLADYLLKNGVIVPPCKVGDTLYAMRYRPISKKYFITPIVVEGMVFEKDDWYITTSNDGCFFGDLLNVDWFITQEAAEQALKERDGK